MTEVIQARDNQTQLQLVAIIERTQQELLSIESKYQLSVTIGRSAGLVLAIFVSFFVAYFVVLDVSKLMSHLRMSLPLRLSAIQMNKICNFKKNNRSSQTEFNGGQKTQQNSIRRAQVSKPGNRSLKLRHARYKMTPKELQDIFERPFAYPSSALAINSLPSTLLAMRSSVNTTRLSCVEV